jgi:hypothetical protein
MDRKDIGPTGKYVYRAVSEEVKSGDIIKPKPNSVLKGDKTKTSYLFAFDSIGEAFSYCFQPYLISIRFDPVHRIALVLPAHMKFENLYERKGYLLTLPSSGFVAGKRDIQGVVGELVNPHPVKIWAVEELTLKDIVLLSGIQVFTTMFIPKKYGRRTIELLFNGNRLKKTFSRKLFVWENQESDLVETIPQEMYDCLGVKPLDPSSPRGSLMIHVPGV